MEIQSISYIIPMKPLVYGFIAHECCNILLRPIQCMKAGEYILFQEITTQGRKTGKETLVEIKEIVKNKPQKELIIFQKVRTAHVRKNQTHTTTR